MKPYLPERIILERSVEGSLITRNVLERLPGVPVEKVESVDYLLTEAKRNAPTISRAKRTLLLAAFRGKFFKACPGQQSKGDSKNICCDYFVINFASNCHMECTYCYLQWYLNFPYMVVYANIEDLLDELKETIASSPDRFFRIGTGELADSLALDDLTLYSEPLVELFAGLPNAVLELKTKSNRVDNLLGLDHRGRTIIAWSMNPDFIQKNEELKTSTIDERLDAAAKCVADGYRVAFHFDPMIHYDGWEEGYREVIERIFRRVPGEMVAWVSLGGLRMNRAQRDLMKQRFPSSILPMGELIPAEDGKLRYFKPIRVEMYRKLQEWIELYGAGTKVYACMERPEVWKRAFGGQPVSDQALGQHLVELL